MTLIRQFVKSEEFMEENGVISYRNRKIKMNTKYHKWIYSSGILYFVVAPLVFLLLFLIGENY